MLTSILEPTHLLLIAVVALLFLGPKRLPALARSLGESVTELRSGLNSTVAADQPVEAAGDAGSD
jgi:sec-independent protein translocase protein TatA